MAASSLRGGWRLTEGWLIARRKQRTEEWPSAHERPRGLGFGEPVREVGRWIHDAAAGRSPLARSGCLLGCRASVRCPWAQPRGRAGRSSCTAACRAPDECRRDPPPELRPRPRGGRLLTIRPLSPPLFRLAGGARPGRSPSRVRVAVRSLCGTTLSRTRQGARPAVPAGWPFAHDSPAGRAGAVLAERLAGAGLSEPLGAPVQGWPLPHDRAAGATVTWAVRGWPFAHGARGA